MSLCSYEFESWQRYAQIDATIACHWLRSCSKNEVGWPKRKIKLGLFNRRASCNYGYNKREGTEVSVKGVIGLEAAARVSSACCVLERGGYN